jgi:hypothetical protein
MKPGVYAIGIVVAVLLVWLVPSYWNISGHAANVRTTLDAVQQHYRTIGESHAAALADATGGLEPDASTAQKIIIAFGSVTRAVSTDQKIQAIDALQKQLGAFFASDSMHVPGLVTNEHFITLNQEITGRGGASSLVFEYNKAASVLREDMSAFPGNVLGSLIFGSQPQFLYLDGAPRDIKVMM